MAPTHVESQRQHNVLQATASKKRIINDTTRVNCCVARCAAHLGVAPAHLVAQGQHVEGARSKQLAAGAPGHGRDGVVKRRAGIDGPPVRIPHLRGTGRSAVNLALDKTWLLGGRSVHVQFVSFRWRNVFAIHPNETVKPVPVLCIHTRACSSSRPPTQIRSGQYASNKISTASAARLVLAVLAARHDEVGEVAPV